VSRPQAAAADATRHGRRRRYYELINCAIFSNRSKVLVLADPEKRFFPLSSFIALKQCQYYRAAM